MALEKLDPELQHWITERERQWDERIAEERRRRAEEPYRSMPVDMDKLSSCMMDGFMLFSRRLDDRYSELKAKDIGSFSDTLEYVKHRIAYNS